MESHLARRRIATISGHFACGDDLSAGATHLLPLNCSSSLSSARPFTRMDSSVLFARQGSPSLGAFMRQQSSASPLDLSFDQNSAAKVSEAGPHTRLDSRVFFARQGAASLGSFMRQASSALQGNLAQPASINNNYGNENRSSHTLEDPLFSRPNKTEQNLHRFAAMKRDEQVLLSAVSDQPPKFARPNSLSSGEDPVIRSSQMFSPQNIVNQWSPRMNVAESKSDYIVTVELPGVGAGDIRVEVNGKNLMITGRGSTQRSNVGTSYGGSSATTYHKREISVGPYQVVWTLPANVNKNNISAELAEGILQINIPKL